MSAKKIETTETKLLKAITNTEETLDILKAVYAERPSNPLYSSIIIQESALKELKQIYHGK